MSNIAIKVENLGKLYRLGEVGTGTISHDLNRWWARVRGKEDPFARIGETNDRTSKGDSDYVWALKNVGFEVAQGEVLGIIGRNGAGKSTLLKLLSKVTQPTTGSIKVKGRIASLLEVGTGFHPEMTGRENVFQNGAILGMRKAEIRAKFDEIVDFAGVERYIDTPVKRYSSGMYVRLAFAVAAFLEPEILIIDEVLAVGDAEFQKKCLGRMKDVSVNDGRTVLFVSHNMAAVSNLCTNGLIMRNGLLQMQGDIRSTVEEYLKGGQSSDRYRVEDDAGKPAQILEAFLSRDNGEVGDSFGVNERLNITIRIKNFSKEENARCAIGIWDMLDTLITASRQDVAPESGYQSFKVSIPCSLFVPNRLRVSIAMYIPGRSMMDAMPDFLDFEIVDTGSKILTAAEEHVGYVVADTTWVNI